MKKKMNLIKIKIPTIMITRMKNMKQETRVHVSTNARARTHAGMHSHTHRTHKEKLSRCTIQKL